MVCGEIAARKRVYVLNSRYLVVTTLAGATDKGAGGSEGARARVDMAAQVAISGDRADSGVAEERSQTGVTIYFRVHYYLNGSL